ncbi:MAG: hypothetical protein KZQ86_16250 [Candidatus Thiodiazotropha sp. (ex Lucinoma kastoroae)]|nr:hypothetical protein [Candidatus Thiodiazotropha sp. (ex Lucinoma kastoroae)]
MKIIAIIMLALVLYGCASNPRIEDMSSEQRANLSKIEIFKGSIERPNNVIGSVTGLSCNRNKYQKQDISEEEALEGIRIKAALLNADAVINTFCQKNSDTDWRNNCWASIKCIGDAVVYE